MCWALLMFPEETMKALQQQASPSQPPRGDNPAGPPGDGADDLRGL